MGADSKIEWTHHTFNSWWGCSRVSPGCERCYAETFSRRVGLKVWGQQADRRFFGDKHWAEPFKWHSAALKAGERHRVFCGSMCDVFEDREDLAVHRARLWRLIDATPGLDWLLLTKRPENAARLAERAARETWGGDEPAWLPNIWLGTTVEDQKRADERIPHLLKVPARVRFLSCEPLLEAVDLRKFLDRGGACECDPASPAAERCGAGWIRCNAGTRSVDWVIVGGESGGKARPFDLAWARSIVGPCKAAIVPVFVKQLGAKPVENLRPTGNVRTHEGRRQLELTADVVRLKDRKGGDPSEWPEELRVRQWPEARS